jgi:hypothetical protein
MKIPSTLTYVDIRQGLGRMATVLRERACRIAYVGNSVTSQRDGYVRGLHAHLGTWTAQPHHALQVGLSGMGSMGCLFTLDSFVLNRKPDLCFIECTTGDSGSRPPLEIIGPVIEGLVRKLSAIGCQCCILHAYRADRTVEDFQPIIDRYERVADHYGIPSIHLGRAVNLGLRSGEWSLQQLFLDGIHTTPEGGRVLATLIAKALEAILSANSPDAPPLGLRLHRDNFEAARLLRPEPQTALVPRGCRSSYFRHVLPYLELEAGNGLVLDPVPGKLAGLLFVAGPHAGDIVVEAESQMWRYSTWDEWCDRDLLRSVIFSEPIRRDAMVRLTVTDQGGWSRSDPSGPFRDVPKLLKLIGFMLYDEHSSTTAETA